MTKSFGDPNRQPRKPSRPYRTGSQLQPQAQPLGAQPEEDRQFQVNLPTWTPTEPAPASNLAGGERAALVLVKPDGSRRLVALFIDLFVCYLIGLIVSLLPFINRLIPLPLVLTVTYLSRDFLFAGRGIGKNFMGFQVVDRRTGTPASLSQSFFRNIILIAPFVAVSVASFLLDLAPLGWLGVFVMRIVNFVASAYVLIVLPMEAYRAFMTASGWRKGDEIAGTTIIEAPMDFSQILPRQ